jgi:hypothetical protein
MPLLAGSRPLHASERSSRLTGRAYTAFDVTRTQSTFDHSFARLGTDGQDSTLRKRVRPPRRASPAHVARHGHCTSSGRSLLSHTSSPCDIGLDLRFADGASALVRIDDGTLRGARRHGERADGGDHDDVMLHGNLLLLYGLPEHLSRQM